MPETLVQSIADNIWITVPLGAILFGCGAAAIGAVANALTSISDTRSHEQSRREIAAYVAEGSLTPDDAERLLNAGKKAKGRKCSWW